MSKNIGYIRALFSDQAKDCYFPDIELDEKVIDYCSIVDVNKQPELDALISSLNDGDVVHILSASKIADSVVTFVDIVERIMERGASLKMHREDKVLSNNMHHNETLVFHCLRAAADFEVGIKNELMGW